MDDIRHKRAGRRGESCSCERDGRAHADPRQINEVKWSYAGNLFFMTTGAGQVRLFDYPSMQPLHDVHAHTASCYCLEFDPHGRFFAVGGADALVGLWDMDDFAPLRTFARAE